MRKCTNIYQKTLHVPMRPKAKKFQRRGQLLSTRTQNPVSFFLPQIMKSMEKKIKKKNWKAHCLSSRKKKANLYKIKKKHPLVTPFFSFYKHEAPQYRASTIPTHTDVSQSPFPRSN